MIRYYLVLVMILGWVKATSQVVLFEDDFESYSDFTIENFGEWVMYDVDLKETWNVPETDFPNEGYTGSGIIFNPFNCSVDVSDACNYSIRETGEKYVSFWTAIGGGNDNYLVSPPIDLNAVSNPTLSFWAKELTDAFGNELFEVLISTSDNTIASFNNNISGVEELIDNCIWYEYSYSLNDYIGEQIYIAIHHVSGETYALHIDDFKVEATSTSDIEEFKNSNISFSPNPVNDILNITSDIIINEIRINDLLGKRVLDAKIKATNLKLPVTSLEKGIYLLEINTAYGKRVMKFIKE